MLSKPNVHSICPPLIRTAFIGPFLPASLSLSCAFVSACEWRECRSLPMVSQLLQIGLGKQTRNIDEQYQLQDPGILLSYLLRRPSSQIDQPCLAACTQRIEDHERIISQPRKNTRRVSAQGEDEEPISNDLRYTPRKQHTRISSAASNEREVVDDSPHEKESARNLHQGGTNRGSDNTCNWHALADFQSYMVIRSYQQRSVQPPVEPMSASISWNSQHLDTLVQIPPAVRANKHVRELRAKGS